MDKFDTWGMAIIVCVIIPTLLLIIVIIAGVNYGG
jgi:hypothetical protein